MSEKFIVVDDDNGSLALKRKKGNETVEMSSLWDAIDGIRYKSDLYPGIVQGGINSETGGTQSASNPNYHLRLRTEEYIRVLLSATLEVPEGFECYWYKYTGQTIENYVGNSGEWLSGKVRLAGDCYYKLSFRTPDNAEITPSDISGFEILSYTDKKPLNILCLGNSFAQDSFAYVPPILNELLPEYAVTYCVGYIGSAGIEDQIAAYENDSVYTWCNVWKPNDTHWSRYAGGGTRQKKFSELFAMADHWDVIYTQGHGQVRRDGETDYDSIDANIVQAGRELCRILQKEQAAPFAYLTGKWLSTGTEGEDVYGETVFESMTDGMGYVKSHLGLNNVIHIGTAIQNARTNAVFDDLGHFGDVNTGTEEDPVWEHLNPGHLLYNTHQQSGIPALLSAYMIVLKILELAGKRTTSIYGSTFAPTTENCIAINAYKAEGMEPPYPMTHGNSVGVDDGEGNILWDNIRAAQEIAVLAHNNPDVMTDCSGVIVSAPEPAEPSE